MVLLRLLLCSYLLSVSGASSAWLDVLSVALDLFELCDLGRSSHKNRRNYPKGDDGGT